MLKSSVQLARDCTPSRRGPTTLEDLLVAIGGGDPLAFEQLYRQQIHIVRGWALQLIRDYSQAEEVAQEVMLAVWRQAGEFDAARGSGHGWLRQLTRNRAIDRIRASQAARNRDHRYSRELIFSPAAVGAPVADLALARMDRGQIQRAMRQISTEQREAIVLAFFTPQTGPQIAAELQIPLSTLKTRIRDGLGKLRRILAEPEPPPGVTAAWF